MDGVHDLGGVDGFGPVTEHTPEEPTFHEEWERRALGTSMAILMGLQAGSARFRHGIERMDPAHYLSSSYYEHWLTSTATLLVEAGEATRQELEQRAGGRFPLSRPDRGTASAAAAHTEPRFAVGDHVRVREWHPLGHTRAPRYVQGKRGVVTRVDGAFNLPDVEAHGGDLVPQPTYSVRFGSTELWGEGGARGEAINVDLWEHYLEGDA